MTSSEYADVVHFMTDDMEVFRQVDYLWLFNAELKFDSRKDFTLDDSSIKPEDYDLMHKLNRKNLTDFLKTQHQQDEVMQEDNDYEHVWNDESLDEEIKKLLNVKQNGANIPLDIVSHMEYFYNTLACDFKTEDPFKSPMKYPALMFKDFGCDSSPLAHGTTLLDKHKQVIFPNSACKVTQSQTTHSAEDNKMTNSTGSPVKSGSHADNVMQDLKMTKQYSWYPNGQIASPTKLVNLSAHDPTPKSISTTQRHASQITANPLAKLSYNVIKPNPMEGFGDYMQQPPSAVKGSVVGSAVKRDSKKDRRHTQFDIVLSVNDLNFKPKASQMKYNYAADGSPRQSGQNQQPEVGRQKQHSMILDTDFHAKKFAGLM